MAKVLVTDTYLSDIAGAIRNKLGVQTTYTPPQMAAAIASIPQGSEPVLQSKTVTENGTVTPDQGYDGLSSVVVNVSGGGTNYFSRLSPLHQDIANGYISTSTWYTDDGSYTDVYKLEANKVYLIMLGSSVGNRFRAAVFPVDIAEAQSKVDGAYVYSVDNPYTYSACTTGQYGNELYKTSRNPSYLYLGIQKTNQNVPGLESFVFEVLF